jgi:hypothetical protein
VKKVLLLVSALLIVFSGVAAVSAYEGHLVNVKAHVENAIAVTADHFNFGTVFPEATLETDIFVGLSESFQAQDRYSTVHYKVYWERKPVPDGTTVCKPENIGGQDYYQMIRDYVDVTIDGDLLADWIDNGKGAYEATNYLGVLNRSDICDTINLYIDPPVFDKWYNELTDPRDPSGILGPDVYCEVEETICGEKVMVPHADLGDDLKVQVIEIVPHT